MYHLLKPSLPHVQAINALGKKARDGTISVDDMAGGTFTISNGGVYGSLLSTPIINPPQSAILGMHSIQQRPMVINGQVGATALPHQGIMRDFSGQQESCAVCQSGGHQQTDREHVMMLAYVVRIELLNLLVSNGQQDLLLFAQEVVCMAWH